MALYLGRTDFLTAFGTEIWQDEIAEWTEADLLKIIRWFKHKTDPDDPESPEIDLFAYNPLTREVSMKTSRFMQVMIPRGFAKTTLFNGLMLYTVGFKLEPYIVYLSETAGHSEQQLQNVKQQIESNDAFIELFGSLNPDRNDPEKWQGTYIQCLNGVTIQALGRGGQVRGKNVGGRRPGKILLDDVEDEESVATEEQRKKTLKWLMRTVLPALPKRKGNVYILGTMLHREAMMMNVLRDPRWITVCFGAMLPDGTALDVKFMTEIEWLKERETYKLHGMLAEFYMEYQSQIHLDADNRKFKPETWRSQIMARTQFEMVALAMDPAISESADADYCTFGVVGMEGKGLLHILDMYAERGMHPRAQIDKYFELHFAWNCDRHGIEAVAYQRALIHLMVEEMARKSKTFGNRAYFAITPIMHGKTGKVQRIEGILAPRFSAGYITQQRRFPQLESEAIDWPNGKKDNLDVIAMAIGLLDPVATLAGETPNAEGDLLDLTRKDWIEIQESWQEQCP